MYMKIMHTISMWGHHAGENLVEGDVLWRHAFQVSTHQLVERRSLEKSVYVSLVLPIAAGSSARTRSRPTPQEQMACRSDASACCAEHIGKPPQMHAQPRTRLRRRRLRLN
jgi:hypothetical protein